MKLAFMGTPDFAVPTLERLIESPHEVRLVVTQPSRPSGRGRKVVDPPIKELADRNDIPVLQPQSLKSEPLDDRFRSEQIDATIIVAYGNILPKSLIDAARLGALNVHGSLLPEYRGAAPIQRALIDGRRETGVTVMKLVPKMDAGPIVAQQSVEIHDDDDAQSLANLLSVLGADLLIRALDDVESRDSIDGEPQDESLATYASKITKTEGEIDWDLTTEEIIYRLRGLTPWPGLFTKIGGRQTKIIQAEPLGEDQAADADDSLAPGTISQLMKSFGFVVRTGSGHLLVTRVQPEGKAAMDATQYMNGYKLTIGQAAG